MLNPFKLEYKELFTPSEEVRFTALNHDMQTIIDLQNSISVVIETYHRHPQLFNRTELETSISDLFYFLVYQYHYVLQYYLGGNDDSRFLVIHFDFLYNHFQAFLEKKDLSDSRSETIDLLQRLYFHLADGEDIKPVAGFNSPEEIIRLFSALKELYEGEPSKYIEIYQQRP